MRNKFNFPKTAILSKEDQKQIHGGLNVRYCAHSSEGGLDVRLYTGAGSCDTSTSCLGCWWEAI